MIAKTSIRFFNKKPVRARWDDESLAWWYAASDLVNALVETKDARKYWYAFKKRQIQLSTFCRQLKLTAADGKVYSVDCLIAELKADALTVDQVIGAMDIPAVVEKLGSELAGVIKAHALEQKAKGETECDCPACAAAWKILHNAEVIL